MIIVQLILYCALFMLMVSHRNTENGLTIFQSFISFDGSSIADTGGWSDTLDV